MNASPETKNTKTLLLIDANSLIHRAFHALPPLTTTAGEPAGALYGLASLLLKIFREKRPAYAAAFFDRPEPTFREEKYADYKAQRPPAPPPLIAQLTRAPELFRQFGIKTFDHPGLEADDLIAATVRRFCCQPGVQIVILTGDLDALQLVDDKKVVVCFLKKGVSDTLIYDAAEVKSKYGLEPEQIVDFKALVGDSADNIPGVAGIGPRTAQKILSRVGGLENFFKHPATYPDLESKLLPHRAEIELNRYLVSLRSEVEIGIRDITDLAPAFDPRRLEEYFRGLGFETLRRRLSAMTTSPQGRIF